MKFQKHSKILFIGDSVTDCGWREQVYQPLGNGYVHFAANLLYAANPELELDIINRGIGGNTIRDLRKRLESDCLQLTPDLVSILIGVNDVWRRHSEPERLSEAVDLDEYEATYRSVLKDIISSRLCRVVLVEPFMFCTESNNAMLSDLRTYMQIVRNIAKEFDCVLVPLQYHLDIAMKNVPPKVWSADMVHPHAWAHAWIAQKWIEVVHSIQRQS